ncbi:MAG: serine/threonine protein kinase [Anaerolineae bacterium]|nr:serine/threonine protein kinase [Anaerolineae bacterium]
MSDTLLHQRYRLVRVAGEGGMGQVWEAEDTQTGQPVAIKQIRPELLGSQARAEEFEREAERLNALNHPNILPVLAFFQEERYHYHVAPFVADWLVDFQAQRAPLPVAWVRRIGLEVCTALSAAHDLGICHHDIKLANVALGADFTPILTDFGLARFKFSHDLTQNKDIVGNVSHMSPEVCRGKKGDHRADIWGLGLLLYELLAGVHPFWHASLPLMVRAIVTAPLPPLAARRPDAPGALVNLIVSMLEKDPAGRVADVRAVAAALDALPGIPDAPWPPSER